jgi:hypothetical protein
MKCAGGIARPSRPLGAPLVRRSRVRTWVIAPPEGGLARQAQGTQQLQPQSPGSGWSSLVSWLPGRQSSNAPVSTTDSQRVQEVGVAICGVFRRGGADRGVSPAPGRGPLTHAPPPCETSLVAF